MNETGNEVERINRKLVMATSALGMGVNIPNITRILHYGIPEDTESNLQAVGRGGKYGGKVAATCFTRNIAVLTLNSLRTGNSVVGCNS